MKSLIIVPFLIGSLPLLGSVAIGYNYLKSKKDSKYLYWGGMSGFIIAGCVASNMIMNRYLDYVPISVLKEESFNAETFESEEDWYGLKLKERFSMDDWQGWIYEDGDITISIDGSNGVITRESGMSIEEARAYLHRKGIPFDNSTDCSNKSCIHADEYDLVYFNYPNHEKCYKCDWSNAYIRNDYGLEDDGMASVEYGQRCEVCDVERRGSIGGDVSWDMDAETFEDGWVKSIASERMGGYPSFLRKKQFHFEKEFTMPPYPNTLKIDVDGYFTGISYDDEDESYFNTPEFIDERKEFVGIYTDERLHKILEDYTMSKVKNYYQEIEWAEDDEDISYCDDYFKEQMNEDLKWTQSWMGEKNIDRMGLIHPTFLPTHIKFVDETRGITLYEYNNDWKDIESYDAETFEAKKHSGRRSKRKKQGLGTLAPSRRNKQTNEWRPFNNRIKSRKEQQQDLEDYKRHRGAESFNASWDEGADIGLIENPHAYTPKRFRQFFGYTVCQTCKDSGQGMRFYYDSKKKKMICLKCLSNSNYTPFYAETRKISGKDKVVVIDGEEYKIQIDDLYDYGWDGSQLSYQQYKKIMSYDLNIPIQSKNGDGKGNWLIGEKRKGIEDWLKRKFNPKEIYFDDDHDYSEGARDDGMVKKTGNIHTIWFSLNDKVLKFFGFEIPSKKDCSKGHTWSNAYIRNDYGLEDDGMASVEYGQRCEVCDVERRGSIGGDVSWDMDAETFEMQPMDKKTMAQFRKRAKQMREMPQAEKDKMRKLAMKDREDSLKRKNAESFSASGGGDLTYEGGRMVSIEEVTIVDYNWHTDPDETDDIDEDDIESQVQEKVANEMYDGDSGNESWSYGTDSDGTNVEVYYEWNKTVEDGGEEFIKGW